MWFPVNPYCYPGYLTRGVDAGFAPTALSTVQYIFSTSFPPKYLKVCLIMKQPNQLWAETVQSKKGVEDQFGVQNVRNFVRTLSGLGGAYKVEVHVPLMDSAGIVMPSSCLELQAFQEV